MICTIWLIVEDPTDADVLKAIVQKRGFPVKIEHVPMENNMTGIFRLAGELQKLIETTKSRKAVDDCIAVLVDAEYYKLDKERTHHKKVQAICESYADEVRLLWAVQEIEAWLLADPGLCKWLDIAAENNDGENDPKEKLQGLLRHHKHRKWQGSDRARVLAEITGTGDEHSPSMQIAIQYLMSSPCNSKDSS